MRRYCKKHGHDLEELNVKEKEYSYCKRCGYLIEI